MRLKCWRNKRAMTDSHEHRICESKVLTEIRTNPCVKLMLLALEKSGCPVRLSRHLSCEPCFGKMKGGFDSKNNQIVICEDSPSLSSSSSSLGRVLSHELVHAFDHCSRSVEWSDPSHLACAEIRAANLTDCSPTRAVTRDFPFTLRRLKAGHRDCVFSRAFRSVFTIRRDDSMEVVRRTVEGVFESCYRDTAPFYHLRPPYDHHDCEEAFRTWRRGMG